MRAFSRIPNNATGFVGQRPVPGQSNRSTQGTYFDSKGILRVAQPYELRPNYVYKSGVWVQQGFLREAQATNRVPDFSDQGWKFFSGKLDQNNVDYGHPDIAGTNKAILYTVGKGSDSRPYYHDYLQMSSTGKATFSVFVKLLTPSLTTRITIAAAWYYTVGANWNPATQMFNDGGAAGPAFGTFSEPCGGGWWRISACRNDGFSSFDARGPAFYPQSSPDGDVSFLFCFPQYEDTSAGGSEQRTSYIPNVSATSLTRAAD